MTTVRFQAVQTSAVRDAAIRARDAAVRVRDAAVRVRDAAMRNPAVKDLATKHGATKSICSIQQRQVMRQTKEHSLCPSLTVACMHPQQMSPTEKMLAV